MNISNQLKGYGFSYFEETLWEEAKKLIDPRLHGNYRKGAVFECLIFLIFGHVIDVLGLKNVIRINHNPYDRKYISRQGKGLDLTVTIKKPTGIWIPVFYIEAKDWSPRFMSPAVFKTHVKQRFWTVIQGTKILITRGVKYSTKTLHKIVDNGYKLIDNNYVDNIRKLIVNVTNKYNIVTNKPVITTPINDVILHKPNRYPYCNTPIPEFNTLTATENNNIFYGG